MNAGWFRDEKGCWSLRRSRISRGFACKLWPFTVLPIPAKSVLSVAPNEDTTFLTYCRNKAERGEGGELYAAGFKSNVHGGVGVNTPQNSG